MEVRTHRHGRFHQQLHAVVLRNRFKAVGYKLSVLLPEAIERVRNIQRIRYFRRTEREPWKVGTAQGPRLAGPLQFIWVCLAGVDHFGATTIILHI